MIATLNGLLTFRSPEYAIVDVGGVGYKVTVSQQSFSKLPAVGEKILLFIHTAVREDDISLYGFASEEEKKIFQKLITVNGIGPKLALTILSGILPDDLVNALHREDLVRLTAIPGIGKKTAERMVLDLKDKLAEFLSGTGLRNLPDNGKRKLFDEALSALLNLGYTRSTAERTLTQVRIPEGSKLENVIRDALRSLSEGGR